jgi:8-oxo-dGTP pyrophosphatase MutT (NUDIX family)
LQKEAAVFILFIKQDIPEIIFTKRSIHLLEHSGEISFPGGLYEQRDKNLLETALRETEEEIGIKRDVIKIIGSLSAEKSLKGKIVKPFVGVIEKDKDELEYTISQSEVDELIFVPVNVFNETNNFWSELWIRNKKLTKMYFYIYKSHIIWGMTGRIIFKLMKEKKSKLYRGLYAEHSKNI